MEQVEDDEVINQLLQDYCHPKSKDPEKHEVLTLYNLERIRHEEKQCFSLHNKKVYAGWKEFLKNLPDSKNEIVPNPEERFWRWKMYKKYVPEVRTDFRKTMKNGQIVDKFGLLPMSAEDARFYRSSPQKCLQTTIRKKK